MIPLFFALVASLSVAIAAGYEGWMRQKKLEKCGEWEWRP